MKKFDPTKPVQTRGGKPARIVATDANSHYPIIALIPLPDRGGEELPQRFTKRGMCVAGATGLNDLINVPPPPTKITRYVNIYRRNGDPAVRVGTDNITEERAREVARLNADYREYLAVAVPVEIEYVEGQNIDE